MRQLTITKSITNRGSLSLDKYLQEIGKVPLITADEEMRLAQLIKSGDEAALNTLTRGNLRFVVSVAKQYQFRGLTLSDLINEGNVGLIKAAGRFDETRGFKFISYAVWWIRQSIIQALSEQARMVRLPGNRLSFSSKVQEAFSHLEQEFERAPSAEELADEMNVSVENIRSASSNDHHYVSLDAPLSDTNDSSLMDMLVDENSDASDHYVDHTQSLKSELMRCLGTLNEREKGILCYFYGINTPHPLSLHEIGLKYNMTGERIRQIKDKAIRTLRTPKKTSLLREYLGA
jgi:RNA polymerase primary sigma factor